MRVFVTGGTGFIGKRLVDAMLARGWDILALARSPERARPLSERGIELVMGDLTSPESYVDRLKECDGVAHLAAVYEFGATDPARLFRVNVEGTRDILRAAADAGVPRIVYCSSVTALGCGPPGSVGDETREHHGNFPTLYEESKWRAHHVVRELAPDGGPVSPVISRLLGRQAAAIRDSVMTLEGASWMFSSARAEREIGYSYRPVEEGMVLTVESFRRAA